MNAVGHAPQRLAGRVSSALGIELPAARSGGGPSVLLGALGTVALNVTTAVVNFLLALVLARELGGTGYGFYAVALAWASLLTVPANLGITPLIIREVATYVARGQWGLLRGLVRRSNEVVLISSFVLAGGAAVLGWALKGSEPEFLHPFLIGLALVPLIALTSVRQAIMQGLGRVVLGRLPETVIGPLIFLGSVAAVSLILGPHLTPTQAMLLNVSASVVMFCLGIYLLRLSMPRSAAPVAAAFETRTWARSAAPFLLLSGFLALESNINTILLEAIGKASDAGEFSIAARTAAFVSFFAAAATYALSPAVTRMNVGGNVAELRRVLVRSGRLVFLGALPIALVFFVAAKPFLGLFGQDFGGATITLQILVGGELVKLACGFAGLTLGMIGHERRLTLGIAIGTFVNIALSALLIPFWDTEGAAIALSIGTAATSIFLAWDLWRRRRIYAPVIDPFRLAARAAASDETSLANGQAVVMSSVVQEREDAGQLEEGWESGPVVAAPADTVEISVVVPAHNCADVIGAQLEALRRQEGFAEAELIVVDDGSTDRTSEVLREWKSRLPNLQVLALEDGGSPSAARNAGLRAARGEFVLFCDADDVVQPGWIDALARALETRDVVGGALAFNELNPGWPDWVRKRPPDESLALSADHLPFAHTGNLGVRRSTALELGGFDVSMPTSEDQDFSWRAIRAGYDIGFSRAALVQVRMAPGLWQLWKQRVAWGMGSVDLYVRHANHAPSGRTSGEVARELVRIASMVPSSIFSQSTRYHLVESLAFFVGRVRGSIKNRTRYL